MMYSGDELYGDEITSGPAEPYCDWCEQEGHTFSACPGRDDEDVSYEEATGDYGQWD